MAKSKTDPTRKAKVVKFKENQKKQNMSQQTAQPDPIRQVPQWKSTDTITLNGLEFEAIYNFINGVQGAYGAMQSVMQRNIVDGTIKIGFEKLNDEKTAYVPMTDEEQAPHKAQFDEMLNKLKAQAAGMVKREDEHLEPESQEGLPHIDAIVDVEGNPVTSQA